MYNLCLPRLDMSDTVSLQICAMRDGPRSGKGRERGKSGQGEILFQRDLQETKGWGS